LSQTIVTSGGGKGIVSSRRDTGKVDVLKKRTNLRFNKINRQKWQGLKKGTPGSIIFK
jgi:hypothetical protein